MLIDLHIHTSRHSTDSSVDAEEAIARARKIGLDGICFTDHNKAWDPTEIEHLRARYGYPVFAGIEIDAVEGHVLVFGASPQVDGPIRVAKLRDMVAAAGGVMIAAHPLKGFRVFNPADLNLAPEQAAQRPMMKFIDAIETYNGRCNERENAQAADVAGILKLASTGGSDAHSLAEIGACATYFDSDIKDLNNLLAALKAGRCNGVKR